MDLFEGGSVCDGEDLDRRFHGFVRALRQQGTPCCRDLKEDLCSLNTWGGDQASQEMARECWVTCLGFILRVVRSFCREFHDLISFLPSLLLVLSRLVYLVYKWK